MDHFPEGQNYMSAAGENCDFVMALISEPLNRFCRNFIFRKLRFVRIYEYNLFKIGNCSEKMFYVPQT